MLNSFVLACFVSVAMAVTAGGQTPANSEPIRIGAGVTPPKLVRKVEPKYTSEALANHIQGTAVLYVVVDAKGRTTNIAPLSPLGFGLDEAAEAAVEKWEFVPGMKDGKAVSIQATVEVNFRLLGLRFDEKLERRRTAFNLAMQTISRPGANASAIDGAVGSVMDLCDQKVPAAMYTAGMWKIKGEHTELDAKGGLDLIVKAAAKNYGPALYQVAARRIEGRELPRDVDKGLEEMRSAALLGSRQAQFELGQRYETGNAVAAEPDRARRYYRLCAAQGVALCQYRLGRLLYNAPDRAERDYLQAVALFQLAAEQGLNDAKQLASAESVTLTAEQATWVGNLKRQIVRK